MVNLSPIAFLSIGFILLVIALNMLFLKYEVREGKNLRRMGWIFLGFSVVLWVVLWVIVWLTQGLSGQEWEAIRTLVIGVAITGFISALRGEIQRKNREAQLSVLCWSIFVVALIGVAFVASSLTRIIAG